MIKFSKENNCVGCESCIRCGRQFDYYTLDDLRCDNCGESSDVLYDYEGNQLCLCCFVNAADAQEINDDNFAEFIPVYEPDIDEEE